jgi:hypothetical protein
MTQRERIIRNNLTIDPLQCSICALFGLVLSLSSINLEEISFNGVPRMSTPQDARKIHTNRKENRQALFQ